MLSRFSSLFAYVVVGLVISAAATPMGPRGDYDDESKAPSYPVSSYSSPSSPKYPMEQPYAKPYAEEKPYPKEKYPEEKRPEEKRPEEKRPEEKYPKDKYPKDKYTQEKPYPKPDDKDKPYGDRPRYGKDDKDDKDRPYGDRSRYGKDGKDEKDRPYGDRSRYGKDDKDDKDRPNDDRKYDDDDHPEYNNQCNVGQQHCCNPVNKSESSDSQFGGILAVLKVMGWPDITDKILNSDKFMGIDCSQEMVGEQCKAQPVCCEDNYFGGALAVGCTNFDLL